MSRLLSWFRNAKTLPITRRVFRPALELLEDRLAPALTIVPEFASNIEVDVHAADIKATINTAIQSYKGYISNNVTVHILFAEASSGLGGSLTYRDEVPYASYLAALNVQTKSVSDDAALTVLNLAGAGAGNPVNGGANIQLVSSLASALGLDTLGRNAGAGAQVRFTVGAGGAINAVTAVPAAGGAGYPANSTIQLFVAGGGGQGAVVEATTNAAGAVTGFAPAPLLAGSSYSASAAAATSSAAGAIRLNMSICNLTRPDANSQKNDLLTTVLHEVNEVLGVGGPGSALGTAANAPGPGPAVPGPLDLFRYREPILTRHPDGTVTKTAGARSYTRDAAEDAYFSLDGGSTDLAHFNNSGGGDYADWFGVGAQYPQVQDAFRRLTIAGVGVQAAAPNLGVELVALDAVGWTLNSNLPDLTISVTNNVGGATSVGTDWTWTLHVTNNGPAAAVFNDKQTIVLDNLPTANIAYKAISIPTRSGVTGTISTPTITAGNLTAVASGQVTIASHGSFDIVFTATASAAATFNNPDKPAPIDPPSGTKPGNNILQGYGGVAVVDPYGVIAEASIVAGKYRNNYGSDTVVVTPTLTIGNAPPITNGNKSNVIVSGTGDTGSHVTVTITDSNNAVVSSANVLVTAGVWTVPGINAGGLADGTVTYTATQTDGHGGSVSVTAQSQKLTVTGGGGSAPTFYWKLKNGAPIIDGANFHTFFTYTDTYEQDAGTVTDVGHLTVSQPDQVSYSHSSSIELAPDVIFAGGYDFDNADTMSWSGAPPDIILPGQTITIHAAMTANFSEGTPFNLTAGAFAESRPSTGSGSINLFTSFTGDSEIPSGVMGDVSISKVLTFTAPTTLTSSYPGVFGPTTKVNGFLEIDESGNFTQTNSLTAFQYIYELVQSAPPSSVTVSGSGPSITNANVHSVIASGTGDDGAIVTVTIADSHGHKVTAPSVVVSGGVWTTSPVDASSLADGPITYTINAVDVSGNTGSHASTAVKRLLAITDAPDILDEDGGLAFTTAAGVGFSSGDTVMVTVTDGVHTTAPVTATVINGVWSLDADEIDASSLSDGPVTYQVTEGAFTVTQQAIKLRELAVTITSAPNITEANEHNVTVTGTGDEGDFITVLIFDGADDGIDTVSSVTVTVNGGVWTVSNMDASGLLDGEVTYVVIETDAAGRTAVDTRVAAKGSLTFTSVSDITNVNKNSIAAAGTGLSGATVSVKIVDADDLETTPVSVTVDGNGFWSVSGIDASGLANGPVTYVATEADADGYEVSVTEDADKTSSSTPGVVVTASTAPLLASAITLFIKGSKFNARDVVILNNGHARVTKVTSKLLTVAVTDLRAGPLFAVVSADGISSATTQVATVIPVVTRSTASIGVNATTLIIKGFGFDPTPANNLVTFNGGVTGTVTAATNHQLTVTNLHGLVFGALTASVRVNGQSSAVVQVATIAPALDENITLLAANASTLIIDGVGFSPTPAANFVKFNNGAIGKVTSATTTQLTVTNLGVLTAGILSATVKVAGATSALVQVATVQPVVTAATANLTGNATSLTIHGFGFSKVAANNMVTFPGGATGKVTSATTTTLTVSGLTGLIGGNLTALAASNGVNNAGAVQVATVIPLITKSTVSLGVNATSLVINGFGFDPTPGNNLVTFNGGVTGVVTAATNHQLTVTSLHGLVTGPLTASVNVNGKTSGVMQVATATPAITISTVSLAANATTLIIQGVGFSTTAAANFVKFNNGAFGKVTAATTTQLTVTSLGGLTGGPLSATVTIAGLTSPLVQVATVQPVVTIATANLAANAGFLIIHGFGFSKTAANNTVTFNGGATGKVTSATATTLTVATLNGLIAGNLTALVTTNSVSSVGAVQVATVLPVVTKSTTSLGVTATSLVITGFGFDPVAGHNTVTFSAGVTGTVFSATNHQLTITNLQGLVVGSHPIATVTVNGKISTAVQVATVTPALTFSAANLAANATTLVIQGVGFSTTAASNFVKFSNGALGKVTSATATQLTVTNLGAPSAGVLLATVTVGGLTSPLVQVATVQPVVTASTSLLVGSSASLILHGFGFSKIAANNNVTFSGGATGRVTSATATTLTVTSLTGLIGGSLTATVTSNSVASASPVQVALVVPLVTKRTADLPVNATSLTIDGLGFDPVAGHNTVTFSGGVTGTVTSATAHQLTVTNLQGLVLGPLTASVNVNGQSSGAPMQVANVKPV